jgi:hypothetical protein
MNSINITTAAELIDAAGNPNLEPVNVTGALLAGAVELIETEFDDAAKAGGRALVQRIRAAREIADRLAAVSTDNTARAGRMQARLAGLVRAYSDNYCLWLLAAAVMTPEQHATVQAAFA